MKKLMCLLAVVLLVFILTSCSLIGSSATPVTTGSSGYPDSAVFKLKLSGDIFLCSSYSVINTDQGSSLQLTDVYSVESNGKIIWIGKEKVIPAFTIEKISR